MTDQEVITVRLAMTIPGEVNGLPSDLTGNLTLKVSQSAFTSWAGPVLTMCGDPMEQALAQAVIGAWKAMIAEISAKPAIVVS